MPLGIGPAELILILIVALVVFGPRRLPELGSSMGKAIREFRRASSELTRDIENGATIRPSSNPLVVDQAAAKRDSTTQAGADTVATEQVAARAGIETVCAGCSAINPASNRFCGSCGKSL